MAKTPAGDTLTAHAPGVKKLPPLKKDTVHLTGGEFPAERKFMGLHRVERWHDPLNGDEVYSGGGIKHARLNAVPKPEFSDALHEGVQVELSDTECEVLMALSELYATPAEDLGSFFASVCRVTDTPLIDLVTFI